LAIAKADARAVPPLSSCQFFFDLGLSAYFFLFNLFLTHRGYAESRIGVLTSVMAIGNLAGAIPASKLIQRLGLRRALQACILLAPAILCLRSLLTTYLWQLILAVLTGMALSLWAVCVSPGIAASTNEQERPLGFSLFFSIGIGVGALGAPIAGILPGLFAAHSPATGTLSEQYTLIACCCIAILGILPIMALEPMIPPVSSAQRPLFSLSLWRFLLAVGLWGVIPGAFLPFAAIFFANYLRTPLPQVGTIFSFAQLAQVTAVLCAPLLIRRCGIRASIVSAQSIAAACLVLLAFSGHPWVASSFYITLTAAHWMNEPGLYSMLMGMVPEEHRGGASASMSFTLSCTQLTAATIAGWAFKHFGYPPTLCVISGIALIAACMFASLPKRIAPALIIERPAD
jgi:MFS family permease